MEQLVNMGMMDGMKSAMGQIDAMLLDLKRFASDLHTDAQLLGDTQLRISRVIRGTIAQLWHAHHHASLMQRWLLGPVGWTIPVCQIASAVGDSYRYEWESADQSQRFGLDRCRAERL